MGLRDNPAARKFLGALLASVGIEDDDGDIQFNQKRDERHAGLHLFTRSFRSRARSPRPLLQGRKSLLERNERIPG